MKSTKSTNKPKKSIVDLELLKHWKKSSTKAKLEWLESALYFGKLKKFKKAN